jgi:excinuclease ABC subunit A
MCLNAPMGIEEWIRVKGARQHNLNNIDVSLPRGQVVVITGVSGSGKSSLAFDTLYAEGYRKYMDSLSVRTRQVLEQLPRPDVDFIEGLSPVIAIEQREAAGANPRSTVATVTEVADYARLLWALGGEAFCPLDGGRIVRKTLDDTIEQLLAEKEGSRCWLFAPFMVGRVSVLRGELAGLRQRGFQRVRVAGRLTEIDDPAIFDGLTGEVNLEIGVDRLVLRADQRSRLADSLELAFREGGNRAVALVQANKDDPLREIPLSRNLACAICGTVYEPLTPRHFSHNHAEGACGTCGGLGTARSFAPELLVPDPSKSVKGGAIKPWRLGSKRMIIERNATLKQLAEQLPFDPDCPWEELPPEVRGQILHGTGERLFQFKLRGGNRKPETRPFPGVLADLERTRRETSSDGLRARLMAYQVGAECPDCGGDRLAPLARAARFTGLGYAAFLRMDLSEARDFIKKARASSANGADDRHTKLGEVFRGLETRLQFLLEVGLGYLTLDRSYASLSGGEAQRVRLATQLGMGLVGVTYVLDEPTIGLHPADTARLIRSMKALRDRGNSVIVVEHDADVMQAADHLVEIGPSAGAAGGRILFAGSVEAAKADRLSTTGRFLSGQSQIERNVARKSPTGAYMRVQGAREHNLQGIDAAFPIGLLTVVTGVSGSGKSTLVNDILGAAAAFKLNRSKAIPGRHDGITGWEHVRRLVRVDQDPIGRSPRSNPATYTKLFDDLRQLYAKCPLSKVRGYTPARFSFNMRGGRCENCQGDGQIKLDMQFLGDVYTECPACQGRRYNRETLEVRFKGLNIADALSLTVDEAREVFRAVPKILNRLDTLHDVGLGYIHLGQAANTLSGGEAQRIKLALELSKRSPDPTLYILDEPTTGLHWQDIQHLIDLLFRLRDQGHTLILIEHHPDVIRLADWLLDLGPGGGRDGGHLLYSGPPESIPVTTPTGGALHS